jgi:hypothetical protein
MRQTNNLMVFLKTLITNGRFLWRGIIDKANVLAVHYERVGAA